MPGLRFRQHTAGLFAVRMENGVFRSILAIIQFMFNSAEELWLKCEIKRDRGPRNFERMQGGV